MKKNRFLTWTVILGALGALWFAADGALSAGQAARARDRAEGSVRAAWTLGTGNPRLFSGVLRPTGDLPLKALCQEAGRKEGIQIAFLTESEKEAGKGKREKQVSARLVRSSHPKLVSFLALLEERGAGAKVKELHLRASKDLSDTYEEAEILFSRVTSVPEARP
jgi:hypothetical protein